MMNAFCCLFCIFISALPESKFRNSTCRPGYPSDTWSGHHTSPHNIRHLLTFLIWVCKTISTVSSSVICSSIYCIALPTASIHPITVNLFLSPELIVLNQTRLCPIILAVICPVPEFPLSRPSALCIHPVQLYDVTGYSLCLCLLLPFQEPWPPPTDERLLW